jgi:hypothetical protein
MAPQVLTDKELMDWWIYWTTNVPMPEDSSETSVELFVKYLTKQSEREAPLDYTKFGGRELGAKWLDYIRAGDTSHFGPGYAGRDFKASRRNNRNHSGSSSSTGDVSESNLDDMPVVHPQREV